MGRTRERAGGRGGLGGIARVWELVNDEMHVVVVVRPRFDRE
jgi:hypothetical protein